MAMKSKREVKAPMDIRMVGYEVVEKVAMPSGTSARILVPRHWIGKRVKVIRVEP
jgi:putative transposon-encoded protein